MSRGLVIAPRYAIRRSTLHFPGFAGIEARDLKFYLLYWDRLDFPDTNILSLGTTPDVQFLMDAGIMARSKVQFGGRVDDLARAYVTGQLAVFRSRESREPGLWSFAQSGDAFLLPEQERVACRTLEVELYKALPVPSDMASLDDVLTFKANRRDELQRLIQEMDALYADAVNSVDIPRGMESSRLRLQNALVELNRVSREVWPAGLFASVKVEVTVPSVLSGYAVGATIGGSVGFPLAGGIAGAAISSLRLGLKQVGLKNLPNSVRAYAYVSHIENELS